MLGQRLKDVAAAALRSVAAAAGLRAPQLTADLAQRCTAMLLCSSALLLLVEKRAIDPSHDDAVSAFAAAGAVPACLGMRQPAEPRRGALRCSEGARVLNWYPLL